jgi:PAS domain S-box-containing protein
MCAHDLTGTLLWVNRAVPDALGYPIDAAVGRNLESFLPSRFRPQFTAYLDRIKSNSVDSGLLRLVAADGTERIWSYRNVLIETVEGPRVLGHALDITDRVRAERELKLSKERLQGLFDDAPIAYLEIDCEDRIRRVNRAGCELLGCTEFGLIGRTIWEFTDRPQGERARWSINMRLTKDAPQMGEVLRIHSAEGREHSVELRVNAIFDRHGDREGARCAMLDITERLQAEEQVRLLNVELEARVAERTAALLRSNAELQQFAYVVSHDLQSPLRQLRSVLMGSGQDPIETGLAITERMSGLVSSLLEHSIVAQSPLRPATSVDLRHVVQESIANLQSAIADSRATIEVGDLPVVVADPTALVQVFQNLIENALKYARSEALVVRISAVEQCEHWVFSVEDNGPGVNPSFREVIFRPFHRLHGRESPGAGVGLAICKKVVERNGGRIWIESEAGRGAIFRFTLPR